MPLMELTIIMEKIWWALIAKPTESLVYNGGIALPCEGVSKFRIDLGNGKDKLITIKDVEYRDYYGKCKFDIRDIAKYYMNDIEVVSVDDNELVVKKCKS